MKLITRDGYFRRGPNKDGRLDSDIIHTISNVAFLNFEQHGKISDIFLHLFAISFSVISLFQGVVCFMLDAACQGSALPSLQEVSGCQTAWKS